MEYTPSRVNGTDRFGTFLLRIMGDEIQLRGSFFMSQEAIDEYLVRRGIAVKGSLVNLGEIARRSHTGGILLMEEIQYSSRHISTFAVSRAKALLKVSRSLDSEWATDTQFLATRNASTVLLHARSKDEIEPDKWVPLYRMGNLLETPEEGRPINLEEVEHVIF